MATLRIFLPVAQQNGGNHGSRTWLATGRPKCSLKFLFAFLLVSETINAQIQREITFEEYNPISTLVHSEHLTTKAKFPFIDVHNHQAGMSKQQLSELIKAMDTLNMQLMVNLSGRNGQPLKDMTTNIKTSYPNRFIVFANIDFRGFGSTDWTTKTINQLKEDVRNGARGLKIFKELGLTHKDIAGKRIPVDDPRLDTIWSLCASLGIPVLIHSAAPIAFWSPFDERNERWLEMKTYPDRIYGDTNPAPWRQIIDEQHRMFKKHPKTIFINAHFGWLGNDLGQLSSLMDEIPNMYVEFGAVIAELGRQPRAAYTFFDKYQDRILFGKDSWVPSEYTTYFRVLETDDEYFPYHKKYHAFWGMYGMRLPDEILKKIYYKNALKIIPGIDASLFPK
jgi:predicted TIM-barrel fold metal-dependent hydrolase